jgi:molybdopterin-guanine dinucleotide biosynthesis protein A
MREAGERSEARPPGVILAGGLSTRMGRDKALVLLAGRPLLAHVIARFAPQVSALALNANGDPARFAAFGLPVLPDLGRDAVGPLAGIECALVHAGRLGADRVAVIPADAPALPLDLVARLAATMTDGDLAAVATGPRGCEPLFALWRTSALRALRDTLASGQRAVRALLGRIPHATAAFDTAAGEDPFANLNTREDLARMESALAARAAADD